MTNPSPPHVTSTVQAAIGTRAAAAASHGVTCESELEIVLSAWHEATERLQKTHQTLQEEVRRLTSELERKNRELARKNRLADLGQMASHVAHEVRNGLAPVTLYLSLLRRRLQTDKAGLQLMDKIEAGFTALEVTVNDLLGFTSDRDPVCNYFSVQKLIDEVRESLAPQLEAQGIRFAIDVPSSIDVLADRDMLRRALLNLVFNALDAMPDGGELIVTAFPARGGIELEVADSGPGVDEELRQRVFEPFFTTKSDGTGLGLAIVYRVAEAHGGTVEVRNCPEGGASFTIFLPQRRILEVAA